MPHTNCVIYSSSTKWIPVKSYVGVMSLVVLKKNFVDFPKIACHVRTWYMMLNIDPTVTVAFSETFIGMVLCLIKENEKMKSPLCGLTTVLPDMPVARI
jgi:hypothetical protein